MSSQRLLIRNGFVVSMDPDVGDIPNGDVLVEDGAIVEVGRGLGASEAEEIDATGMIVMPGFVDTHRHTWQTPVRGVLPSCTLDHYFAVMLGQVGGFYRPEDVHIGDYAGALEALNGGVTTLLDWSHISNTPDHSDAAIQGLKDAGIRAVYAHGMPTGGEWWMLSELNHPEDIRRIRETYFSSDDGLLTLAMAARQPGNVNADVAKHDWALARELGILISVHVGMRLHNLHYEPVKDMHDLGLMGPGRLLHPHDRPDRPGARLDRRDRRQGVDRALRRDADGARAAADGEDARPRRPPVAQRRRRLERPGRDVHADADGARLRPDPRVHRHAGHRVRAEAHAQGRARVRDDRRRAIDHARGQGRLAHAGQAGGHRPAEDQRDQHGADARPDRRRSSSSPTRRTSTRCSSPGTRSSGTASSSASTWTRCSGSSTSRGTTSSVPGGLLPDWAAESAAARVARMAAGKRRRRRRNAGPRPRGRAVLCRRRPRRRRDREGPGPRGGCRRGDRRQHPRHRVRPRRPAHDRGAPRGRGRRRLPRARRDRARHEHGRGVRHRRGAAARRRSSSSATPR